MSPSRHRPHHHRDSWPRINCGDGLGQLSSFIDSFHTLRTKLIIILLLNRDPILHCRPTRDHKARSSSPSFSFSIVVFCPAPIQHDSTLLSSAVLYLWNKLYYSLKIRYLNCLVCCAIELVFSAAAEGQNKGRAVSISTVMSLSCRHFTLNRAYRRVTQSFKSTTKAYSDAWLGLFTIYHPRHSNTRISMHSNWIGEETPQEP